jgi:hypothetical protein
MVSMPYWKYINIQDSTNLVCVRKYIKRKEYKKKYQKEYRQSDKRKEYQKEYMKEYMKSDNYKEYVKSDKRKESHKEYKKSDKYKEYQKNNIIKIYGKRFSLNTCQEQIKPMIEKAIQVRNIENQIRKFYKEKKDEQREKRLQAG